MFPRPLLYLKEGRNMSVEVVKVKVAGKYVNIVVRKVAKRDTSV